jgi:hypothetical protein
MTLQPNPITGVLGAQKRDDVDVAAQVEFVEQLPGETEFDQIAKAQASAPHVRKRILELEDCLCAVADALAAHESETSPLVERAKFLLKNRLEVET